VSIELGSVDSVDAAGLGMSGVVDENVETTEVCDGLLDEVARSRGQAQVDFERSDIRNASEFLEQSEGLTRFDAPGLADVVRREEGDEEFRTGTSKLGRDGRTDSRATCNSGD
jgi:hypothetical protein